MKNKNVLVAALLVVFAAIIVYSIIIIARPNVIELQGVCEAKQIRIASKLLGRIENLNISKGDNVRAGQLLFTMNSPEVDAKRQQAEAAKQAATALKNKAYNGARVEDINAAYNVYLKAKAAAEFTTKTYSRILKLYKDGVVSEQKKDEIETKMVASIKTESAAKSVWEKAKKGARQEDKAAAQALVEKANAVIKEINIYENEINIFSPIDGEVANIISEVGELIPNGYPVVTIVDLKDVWFSFNIKETYLPKFKKGTIFKVFVPGIDKQIEVKVTYINALADFATWKATKSSGEFDIKTFEIQVCPTSKVEGLRPGMSAIYEF